MDMDGNAGAQRLSELLRARGRTLRVEEFETIDSTNAEAKRRISAGERGAVLLVAQHQTAGRGRLGRSFYSPAQTGLYMTLTLGETERLGEGSMLTVAAASAAALAIEKLCGARTQIKWVNDVYMAGRKVCGILCEAVTDAEGRVTVLAGIGVNIATRDFPQELRQKAGALPVAVDRLTLAAEISEMLLRYWDDPEQTDLLTPYRERSFVPGNRITFERGGEMREALALAIDDAGGLRLRYDDGQEETLRCGEVSVRMMEREI